MIVAIVGATATGKSDLSVEIATTLASDRQFRRVFPQGVEIVCADAFQLYRGMDIGTAKLSESEQRQIAHHQISVLWPDQDASVAVYQREARRDVQAIQDRGALPLVVGGSGLYVRALLDKLDFPPTDPQLRRRWEQRLEQVGSEALHQHLAQLDPLAATAINPRNGRRIVRALEAIELSGKPFSASLPTGEYWQSQTLQIYLRRESESLKQRIQTRTRNIFARGFLDEVQALMDDSQHPLGKTAAKATGYAQAQAVLKGQLSLEQGISETAQLTVQLAKRQHRWFKRDQRAYQLHLDSRENPVQDVVNLLEARLSDADMPGWATS